MINVPVYQKFEHTLYAAETPEKPLQNAWFKATITAPDGTVFERDGFWDGGTTWRLRFMPRTVGVHQFVTDSNLPSLKSSGEFEAKPASVGNEFFESGPIQLSETRTFFEHYDKSPFLFLCDTGWYGAMRATDPDWRYYCLTRKQQGFSAVQFMASNWWGFCDDGRGRKSFEIADEVEPNIEVFQLLDRRVDELNLAGLLAVPSMLWAAVWHDVYVEKGSSMQNPGNALSEEQAILICKYMVARWGADHVLWMINGDGNYVGEAAERWNRIGRAVFGDDPHRFPVTQHHQGVSWTDPDMQNESWFDIVGYQSGHGDSVSHTQWLTDGPPATQWQDHPQRVTINLEPMYEGHHGYESHLPISSSMVRRAMWWSLLVSPTAGSSYGGHGVWGWDNGDAPPEGHASTGVAPPWDEALHFEGAQGMRQIDLLLWRIRWWDLRPNRTVIANQPFPDDAFAKVVASTTLDGDQTVIYAPNGGKLNLTGIKRSSAKLFSPRSGEETRDFGIVESEAELFLPFGEDSVLILESEV